MKWDPMLGGTADIDIIMVHANDQAIGVNSSS